jgi:hypothetical protein
MIRTDSDVTLPGPLNERPAIDETSPLLGNRDVENQQPARVNNAKYFWLGSLSATICLGIGGATYYIHSLGYF